MSQPIWVTPAGNLGTIPENVYYQVSLTATAGSEDVYFRLISGTLPSGIQVTTNGIIEGIPKNIVSVQGVPQEVSEDVTSRFAVRAYTRRYINGQYVVDRLADRTFEITVSGQSVPQWVTPAGRLGVYYDGTEVNYQLEYTDTDPDDQVRIRLSAGALPPGLVLDPVTGLISGVISPVIGPPDTAEAGYDTTPYDELPYDFTTRAASKNFQFSLDLTDGKDSNIRTFTIFVYARDSMSADNTDITADNTFVTADTTPTRVPLLLTPPGDLGMVRADNYFAFKFNGIDLDGDAIEYIVGTGVAVAYDESTFDQTSSGFDQGPFSLPPGLQLNANTGWMYGYIPDQGATQYSYRFTIVVRKKDQPEIRSEPIFFTMTIVGNIETEVRWLTPSNLGTINNGAISEFYVSAINVGGRSLQYQLLSGSDSSLPQGLTLQSNGLITGRVSFNTFALDGGTTTFDANPQTRLQENPTTFDLKFDFTVNAFSADSQQIGYKIQSIVVTDGGSGYTSQPTITIAAPPSVQDAISATAGVVTITGGVITNIALGNPGRGYNSPPVITITGGGGTGATAVAVMEQATLVNPVSVFKTFTITVNRAFNEPYETLFVRGLLPLNNRDYVESIVQNQDVIPQNLVYRADDPNFGLSSGVEFVQAYGLTASTIADYVTALQLNHYLKNLVLGPVRTAQALDDSGNVVYEVIYSEIIDNLVNAQGESVDKSVLWPTPIPNPTGSGTINTVYPNSLINMRDQVIDTVGQISPALPRWMTSKQQDGRVLGYQPAWIIAYVKPGNSARIAYNFTQEFGDGLNTIDFEVDRYTLDRSQTHNWNPATQHWIPSPAQATVFDVNGDTATIFDANSTRFIRPADRWTPSDEYDKYLVFPKRTILG